MDKVPLRCPKCGHDEFEGIHAGMAKNEKLTCMKCRSVQTYERIVQHSVSPDHIRKL
jgi:transposase-like protein